ISSGVGGDSPASTRDSRLWLIAGTRSANSVWDKSRAERARMSMSGLNALLIFALDFLLSGGDDLDQRLFVGRRLRRQRDDLGAARLDDHMPSLALSVRTDHDHLQAVVLLDVADVDVGGADERGTEQRQLDLFVVLECERQLRAVHRHEM